MPLFAGREGEWERIGEAQGIIDQKILDALPERLRRAANEAISLYRFFEKKPDVNYVPVFTALLGVVDELAKRAVVQKLSPAMPTNMVEQRRWFEPHFGGVDPRTVRHYEEVARNLRKTLVYHSGVSPLGLLRSCMDYALNDNSKLTGVFKRFGRLTDSRVRATCWIQSRQSTSSATRELHIKRLPQCPDGSQGGLGEVDSRRVEPLACRRELERASQAN